jgi:hypothetical protein
MLSGKSAERPFECVKFKTPMIMIIKNRHLVLFLCILFFQKIGFSSELIHHGVTAPNDQLIFSTSYVSAGSELLIINAEVVGRDTIENPNGIELMEDNRLKNLMSDTANVGWMGLGFMGVLYILPENISNWNRDEMKLSNLGAKWKENVKNGPVMDRDDWTINYIGHTYFGAVYYTLARHNGFTAQESFLYSALMSTFFWEYGVEALAEKPSIQDLIITPVFGAIVGEQFYRWDQKIRANDGMLGGSKSLGTTTLFLMNPAQEISKKMNQFWGGRAIIKDSKTELIIGPKGALSLSETGGVHRGIKFKFKF